MKHDDGQSDVGVKMVKNEESRQPSSFLLTSLCVLKAIKATSSYICEEKLAA